MQILLLAAGASRRFGSPKQLALVGGQPMVRHAASRALAVPGARVTVVVGAHAAAVAAALAGLPVRVVVNPHWSSGLASSLRAGVRSLSPAARAVLVMLADQVSVGSTQLSSLSRRWRLRPGRIVAAGYAGVCGVPAIFPRRHFRDLCRLRGDQGARQLLRARYGRVVTVPVPTATWDVDVPADLPDSSSGA